MRKTSNYGLVLYDKNDKMKITDPEDSLNASMEKIDEVLKNIENTSTGGGTEVSAISIGDTAPTGDEILWVDTSGSTSNNSSYLKTLKVGVLGDSITYGYGVDHDNESYPALLKKDFKEVINYGVSSTLLATTAGTSSAMCVRYKNMDSDLDVIIVMGGTNDFAKGANSGTAEETFGDRTSTDKATFYGALNTLMSGLIDKYPGKRIFFCSPIHINFGGYTSDTVKTNGKTLYDYHDAIKEMCEKYSISFIDTMSDSGMDIAHSKSAKTLFTTDGCHPNVKGQIRLHDTILQAIKNTLGELDNPQPVVIKYKDNDEWKILSDRGTASQEIATISSIDAVYTQSDNVIYPSTPLNDLKSNLVVTATYSDGHTSTIGSSSYTLTGTLTEGTSTITVTYNGLTDTFTVVVTAEEPEEPVTISSIDAVYTQGDNIIYPTASLDDLKSNLVVTATYSDGNTATIDSAEYTLTGTLTEGTSTITVTYSGLTDTFTVTVAALPPYTIYDYIGFDGKSYIDTNVLPTQNHSFDIKYRIGDNSGSVPTRVQAILETYGSNNKYFGFNYYDAEKSYFVYGSKMATFDTSVYYPDLTADYVSHNEGNAFYVNDVVAVEANDTSAFQSDYPLLLGAVNNRGTVQYHLRPGGRVYYCKIYEGDTLIRDFVGAKRNSDNVIGILDRVNNVFYENQGTGTFTTGSVI